jgi:tetratricopeptide (TPR) repeat protein
LWKLIAYAKSVFFVNFENRFSCFSGLAQRTTKRMSFKNYSGVGWLVLSLALVMPAHAQKRKKNSGEVLASASREREAEFYFTEGEKYFILEDYAKALFYYEKTLEIAPENATVHFKIADVLNRGTKEEDLQRAANSIDQALRLEKKNKYFYLLAANIYNGLSRFDKAADTYEQLTREIPGTEDYLFELAATYQYANKPEDAIKAYTRAENVLGVNEMSSIQKIRLYLELGKSKDALLEGDKLVLLDPSEPRYAMSVAELFSQRGDKASAIVYLKKFIADNTDEAGQAKMMLAGIYRENNQVAEAEFLLLEVFDDSHVDFGSKALVVATLNAELGQAKNAGQPATEKEKLATQLYEKLVEQYTNESQLHILGGDLYLTIGKQQQARQEYEKAVSLGEVNFEVWQNLLYIEAQQEQFDALIKHAEQALEYFPAQGMVHYFLGYGKFRKQQHDEAVVSFEESKKLSASNPAFVNDLNGMLGDAYNSLKQYGKSDSAYEEALAYNPKNEFILNNYSYYLSIRKENLEKAEKMAEQLIKDHPENATYLDTYAWVLYARDKHKEAKRVIEKAINSGQANATHFEHYGDILYKLGEVDNAVVQWQKAHGLNAKNELLNKKIANRKIYE